MHLILFFLLNPYYLYLGITIKNPKKKKLICHMCKKKNKYREGKTCNLHIQDL